VIAKGFYLYSLFNSCKALRTLSRSTLDTCRCHETYETRIKIQKLN